jgi:hypothetical protein
MPAPSSAKPLYRIDECPDLMADGCVGDEQGQSRLSLDLGARHRRSGVPRPPDPRRDEQGLDQFHVITEQGASIPVFVGNVENLEKRITRAYRRTLFGSLTNVWLFDRRCVKPDKANASALALLPRDSAHRLDRLWTLVQDTCPLPLLDHWRDTVLELLQTRRMLTGLPLALGPLEGHRLALDVPALTKALGDLIRNGTLAPRSTNWPRTHRFGVWREPSPRACAPRVPAFPHASPGEIHGTHVSAPGAQFHP